MMCTGGCHCGNVRFEVEASTALGCHECNCSIYSKASYLRLIVPLSQWRLLRAEESLATYIFGSGIAKHAFRRSGGVKSFHTPRSNPDGGSVNIRCLEPIPESLAIDTFDGQHWETKT